ncbi:hypothetical protein M409DRAFT_16520 [Zasmidium cellare ATCC 36951]|uniref:Cytochrome P450 n=1 Tax=Zasmidium cellare ATCC 36951 TaxID=1080233 RepID=A0A6A6D9D0_ZASCE|nr:uncharacterized protein M409DRAFT_16520 [Zasmidium cellare ATCC 36951]KAF2174256.1 hypothetical protein M409DRAFT_16520 [Zasmidium cellare ATCC 36951]
MLLFIVVAVIVGYITWTYYSWRRLAHIPGPAFCGFTQLRQLYWIAQGQPAAHYAESCARYGKLVRVGPNQLITGDAEQWRKMGSIRSSYTRSNFFEAARFRRGEDSVLSMRDEKAHTDLRAKLGPGYSGKEVPGVEAIIDKSVTEFVELVQQYVSTREVFRPMDLSEKVNFFTLDVISALAFGEPFDNLRDDKDNPGIIGDTQRSITLLAIFHELPYVYLFLEKTGLLERLQAFLGDDFGFNKVFKIADAAVERRFGKAEKSYKLPEDKNDMMGSFIRHGLSRKQIENETVLQVLAGSDTTAGAIRSILVPLMSNAQAQKKLVEEIDRANITGVVVTDAEARNMPYLQACIKEGMRWQPPAPTLLSRKVPPEGDTINGLFVPGGTKIGWSGHAIHHDEDLFGPDADIFRPERWILCEDGGDCDSPSKLTQMNRVSELQFSYGRFRCLGEIVARIEINKILVELFRRFEVNSCNPLKVFEMNFSSDVFVQAGMWVRVTDRRRA